MEKNYTAASSGSVGFTGLLTIAFIILKLTGFISWSWFWVLSPIWISVAIVLIILLVTLIIMIASNKDLGKRKWLDR